MFMIVLIKELTEFLWDPGIVRLDISIWIRCRVPGSLCAKALGGLPRHFLTRGYRDQCDRDVVRELTSAVVVNGRHDQRAPCHEPPAGHQLPGEWDEDVLLVEPVAGIGADPFTSRSALGAE